MPLSSFDALVGPAYSYPSRPVDCQECINFECLNVGSSASPYRHMLVSTAGTRRIRFRVEGTSQVLDELPTVTASVSRIRGIHRCSVPFKGETFEGVVIVGSDAVWKLGVPNADMVCPIRRLGVISEGFSPVSIVDAGGESGSRVPQKVVIADGTTMYMLNMDDSTFQSFASLGNTVPQRPSKLAYLDARVYMCGTTQNDGLPSQRVYWSAINRPDVWEELDFVSAAMKSDPVKAVAVAGSYLWMIGTETFELWQTTSSTGTLYSPIRKVNGVASGVGTCSGDSVASIASSVFFVGGGETGRLHVYEGSSNGSVSVISTDAMSMEFAKYKTLDDAIGMCWSDDGQVYYSVTFPTQDVTWVYNAGQKYWHKRSSRKNTVDHRWNITCIASAYSMVLGANGLTGELYHVSTHYNDDDGEPIVRRRVAPHLKASGRLLMHKSVEVELECGNALPYGQGSDPQVMLCALDGAGRIRREPRWKSSGTQGMYRRRVKWYRLGTAVDRCYEICVSDPVRWVIYGAVIDTEEGMGGK